MNTIKTLMLLLVIALFTACSSDDTPKNNPPVLEDMAIDISILRSDLVTTITASDIDEDTLTYSIISQTPANSVSVNSVNGEVYVSNASAFNYDLNQSITVNIKVSDGKDETTAQLVITINDPS